MGLPQLPEPYFEPMWDVFNETGTVANFHISAGARREDVEALRSMRFRPTEELGQQKAGRPVPAVADHYWRYFGNQRRLAVHASQGYLSNARIIANLLMSDLFDRYPNLKVVSAESGIGWVPFMLESLEYQLDEMVTDPAEVSLQRRRPTEYFRDHMYVMFWFERIGPEKLIRDVGVDNVLVETDVPHPTCLYPGAREHFSKVLAGVDGDVRRRILQDNAAALYRIPLD